MRIVLIGGTSLCGKSTLAARVGAACNAEVLSTDRFGRHPGRPWPAPRAHVAEYYDRLGDAAIDAFLLDHHANLLPRLQAEMDAARRAGRDLVIEGSAIRPEFFEMPEADVFVRWLLVPEAEVRARIERESAFATRDAQARARIERFADRAVRDGARVEAALAGLADARLDGMDVDALERFVNACAV